MIQGLGQVPESNVGDFFLFVLTARFRILFCDNINTLAGILYLKKSKDAQQRTIYNETKKRTRTQKREMGHT